jgi:putative membrane protein
MNTAANVKEKSLMPLIVAISIIIPLAVTILFFGPKIDLGGRITILPLINAWINGLTTLVLITAFWAIKNKNVELHKRLMYSAFFLSIIFLVLYIAYHSTAEPAKYGGEGFMKLLYYFILITHVFLAAAIVPMVLLSYARAYTEKFDKHKKIARWTLPLWLYVSVTGVIVYFMIAPYY